jgi:diguanylate cyclase (GGDEF)-like protein
MAYFFQPSLSGLLAQAMGAILMASLCAVLLRTVRRPPLVFWSFGWVTLFFSLLGLWLAFYFETFQRLGQTVYLLGQYVFGYLVLAGCRSYAQGVSPKQVEVWLLVPALGLSLGLTAFAGDNANVFFALHSLVFPYLFFHALRVLRHMPVGTNPAPGLRVLKLALLLLTINYLHYAPFFAVASYQNLRVVDAYLAYAPLYDLIFQTMLMFGMVMVVTGQVQQELEGVRDRLETMAQLDPLTSALNRRAFSAVVDKRARTGPAHGCGTAAVVDLDNLKALNDLHGHAAGDVALQALSAALRSCMQDGDLLFRWGGDEFVVLLDRANEAAADARLSVLNDHLRQARLPGLDQPIDLRASVGLSAFDELASLEVAIARADQAMYQRKKGPGDTELRAATVRAIASGRSARLARHDE